MELRARGRCTPERPRFADAPFVRSWRELVVGTPTVAEEMGCGASKDASSAPKEPIAPKKKNASKLEGAASAGISGVDATAAVTVAAGAATIVAGATSDGARGALGQAASAAGGALLNFAKELPWVAPIAFLVAGVVEAAANVHALKRDAQIFAANVQSVENVMVDAARKGHLSKVEETCMALQFEMEEGLAFCHKLKTQYFVTQMLMGGRDCQKFKDISDSMHRQVTIIAAAASIAVHDIVMEEYEQGAQLADKIAELGGPAAVAADPEKKAACQEFMTASDALLHGAVDEVQRAVRAEAVKSQKKMDMLMEQSRAQTKVLEDQVANLAEDDGGTPSRPAWGCPRGARGWTFRDRTGAKQASRARKLLLPRTTPPWTARWRRASTGTRSETSCAACPWRTPRRSASRWWTSTA